MQHQKEQTVVQLKKVYSDLCGAVSMSEALNGSRQHWDYSISEHDFFYEYLTPYINISKDKKSDVQQSDGIIYRNLSGTEETGLSAMKGGAYIVTLNSGVQVFSSIAPNPNKEPLTKGYIFDINGQKKPNKIGRDLFFLVIHRDLGVIPHNFSDGQNPALLPPKTREQLKNGPSANSYQCNKQSRGMWCAALIMADGWQIKDDYPW